MEETASRTPGAAARRAPVRSVTAIQAFPGADGRWQTGLCVRLPRGAPIEIRGPGFSAGTVLAQLEGAFYFVLRASLKKS